MMIDPPRALEERLHVMTLRGPLSGTVTLDEPGQAIITNETTGISPVFVFVGAHDHHDGPTWLQLLHAFRKLRTP